MDLFKAEDAKAEVKKEEESKLKQKKETAQEDKDFTDFFKLLNQRKKVDF